jgi:Protein of unknown function (DUF3455)
MACRRGTQIIFVAMHMASIARCLYRWSCSVILHLGAKPRRDPDHSKLLIIGDGGRSELHLLADVPLIFFHSRHGLLHMPQIDSLNTNIAYLGALAVSRRTAQNHRRFPFAFAAVATTSLLALASLANASEIPSAVASESKSVVEAVHASGVQIYECKTGADGNSAWQFREPLATLMVDGETVGRHFAGPSWELEDGSRIKGKVVAQAPGASEKDIPVLRLVVVDHGGEGKLSQVSTVQRLETFGGYFAGSCGKVGELHLEPYSADYVFLR